MRTVSRKEKTRVVKVGVAVDNDDMNLFLALFWLMCAAVLLAYQQFLGGQGFRIRWGGINLPAEWLMLALALYNVVRWWSNRAYREELRRVEIARARSEWERRRHHSQPAEPPDPNFNFTDEQPPTNRGVTDQPPSNN
jgi:hypothetical protein